MRGFLLGVGWLILCGPWGSPASAAEPGFRIRLVETHLANQVYLLNARIEFRFSRVVLEALDSGVPVTILLELQVLRDRDYLWDERIADLKQRYRLAYHALSGRYVVQNQNTGVSHTYQTLDDALYALGSIRAFPLIDRQLMKPGGHYYGKLEARLDIESLPAPLRPLAYLNSKWRLASDVYTWPLQP